MAGLVGGGAGDPGAPTINAKKRRWRPPWGVPDGDLGPPTTYVGGVDGEPLGGANRDSGAPTTYVRDIDGRPLGRQYRRSGSAHINAKSANAGGPRVLTIKAKNVDGGPHGGRCQRSGSAHHQH
jgi:hypothetical protein